MKRPLFEQLREVAKDDAPDDAAWRARAAGTLSKEEASALEARGAPGTEEELLARTTAPLSSAEEDALLDLALGATKKTTAKTTTPVLAATPASSPARAAPPSRPRRLRVAWAAPAMAAAAALVLWAKAHQGGAEALPVYAIEIEGVDHATRGDETPSAPTTRQRLSPGARVGLVARPGARVTAPVAAAAYVVVGGQAIPVAAPVHVTDAGLVSLEGTREELFGTARGPVDVVVWIGAPTALPTREHARAPAPETPGVQRLVVPLDLP